MATRKQFDSNAFTVENFESFMRSFYGPHVPQDHLATCPMAQFSKHIAGLERPSAAYDYVLDVATATRYDFPAWGEAVAREYTMHWRTLSIEDIIAVARENAPVEEKGLVTA